MKQYRMNRLFNEKTNKCFDVALDHGFFNQSGFLAGIENIREAVETVVKAAPDAVQLTPGRLITYKTYRERISRHWYYVQTWQTFTAGASAIHLFEND